jgi:FG-GAP-like repeat/FG-GAP repeat
MSTQHTSVTPAPYVDLGLRSSHHKRLFCLLSVFLGVLLLCPALLSSEKHPAQPVKQPPTITWKKINIERVFRSEGVGVGDFNKDGKLDIVIGDVWYEAPDWKKHVIREERTFDLLKYSECFGCFVDDFNGDGWPDVVVVPFPGLPIYWYENPKGQAGPWKAHLLCHSCCNESPQFADLFGKGKKVLIFAVQPKGKDNQGQMVWLTPGKDPTQPWEMHAISEPSAPGKEIPCTQRFSHGLGVGDMNGDGRPDVICTAGWWEQPKEDKGQSWLFHPAKLGGPCADMHAYDLDGDGKMDVISSSAHNFGIWCQQQRVTKDGKATFVEQTLFKDLLSQTHALECHDLNGDGLKDFVTGRRWWAHGPKGDAGADGPGVLYWFEAKKASDGLTTFSPHLIDDDSGVGTQFCVVDLNGDGLLDIVVANKKGVHAFLQVRNN